MAPLRRYLRITKHSVLEVRIYLDRPSDAEAWLLRRDDPALPRVIQAVRPLVLPKLREENERTRSKGSSKAKKKGVKDVVIEDDFEVSIFLTELSSRHSVLTKQKTFVDRPRLQSNSGKLTGWLTTGTSDQPMVINDGTEPVIVRGEDDDEVMDLNDIPEAMPTGASKAKKRRRDNISEHVSSSEDEHSSDDSFRFDSAPLTKRNRTRQRPTLDTVSDDERNEAVDDKKMLGINTSYDGFSIYGRILCLVVKRKGVRNNMGIVPTSSQQMLENWVSTQAAAEQVDNDDENT
ncbi:hypothetical protein B0J11DRAFT_290256 [Dendryphion nanum]|uniref:Uncharacterized protein n=1 Tax=Dendryphion nanum TaxID=256645 RepID=A0A9P9DUR1_9PLEO|nr:hypothetical protein B0J11DRAFT_290256 [Dendryphion nanum]